MIVRKACPWMHHGPDPDGHVCWTTLQPLEPGWARDHGVDPDTEGAIIAHVERVHGGHYPQPELTPR